MKKNIEKIREMMREHADDGDYAQDRAIISKDEDIEREGESLKALRSLALRVEDVT